MDERHEKRIRIIQNLFAQSFDNGESRPVPNEDAQDVTTEIDKNRNQIDEIIARHAPKYPLDKIAKTDLAILRLAVYELTIDKQEPVKVVINEAVELGREMGNDRSYAFINAVLGSILTEITDIKES